VSETIGASRTSPGSSRSATELPPAGSQGFASRSLRARLITIAVLVAVLVTLLLALPALQDVANEIGHLDAAWVILAVALEIASCASFVVVFRHFFAGLPARPARELAWTEMGSGALLPGGGVGSLAVGGWLLHLAGMPTRQILRSSSGLFFLTSAVNVAALIAGGTLLASGLSAGRHDVLRAGLPIIAGLTVLLAALAAARMSERRTPSFAGSSSAAQLASGAGEAARALRHPSWRLGGALGYLGFDIAVLWATLSAVGYSPPLAVLVLGYIVGYLANLIPVPGAIGVLEGGLAGTLVLYGAPLTQATAGVLVYHAIAFWLPSLGGLLAYRQLRRDMPRAGAGATPGEGPSMLARRAGAVPAATSEVRLRSSCTEQSSRDLARERVRPPTTINQQLRTPISKEDP
jgi:uncharacterized membrane protein YbhN (UPF0104 family)